jgi:hypothetical protein
MAHIFKAPPGKRTTQHDIRLTEDDRQLLKATSNEPLRIQQQKQRGSSISPERSKKKRKKSNSYIIPALIGIVALLILGIVIYAVVVLLDNEDHNDSSHGSVESVQSLQQSPLDQYHQVESAQVSSGSNPINIASLSYAFSTGNEIQVQERHPATGSLLSIPYENLRYYTVCCGVRNKNFICLGGVSYSRPGMFFEASLEFDEQTGEIYLAIWINGKDLLGAGCYAHISYLPP